MDFDLDWKQWLIGIDWYQDEDQCWVDLKFLPITLTLWIRGYFEHNGEN